MARRRPGRIPGTIVLETPEHWTAIGRKDTTVTQRQQGGRHAEIGPEEEPVVERTVGIQPSEVGARLAVELVETSGDENLVVGLHGQQSDLRVRAGPEVGREVGVDHPVGQEARQIRSVEGVQQREGAAHHQPPVALGHCGEDRTVRAE